MRVKIGSQWISSDDQPLAVEFTEAELTFIKQTMDAETAPSRRFMAARYLRPDEARAWVRELDRVPGQKT